MAAQGTDAPAGGELPVARALSLASLVDYAEDGVVSRGLRKSEAATLTLLAFDAGQELSEHSTPFDAWLQVLEGSVELTIDGERVGARAGDLVVMPANVPHAVRALERFKMVLLMLRG